MDKLANLRNIDIILTYVHENRVKSQKKFVRNMILPAPETGPFPLFIIPPQHAKNNKAHASCALRAFSAAQFAVRENTQTSGAPQGARLIAAARNQKPPLNLKIRRRLISFF